MIIIIDAYNILKYFYQDEYITEKQRSQFVQQLIRYGKKKGHELLIIFDGGPYGLPDRIVKKPATVVYTGAQERADDYIIREMKKYKGYDLLIVSTDREITGRAEKHNIPYIDAHLFYTFVRAALNIPDKQGKKSKPALKLHKESDTSIDELMESVEVPVYLQKDDEDVEQAGVKGKKLSKNERRLMSVVEKL